ncbi:hypothetical protein FA15DRAFT_710491, partial [Coprinopsis marcescibilis]
MDEGVLRYGRNVQDQDTVTDMLDALNDVQTSANFRILEDAIATLYRSVTEETSPPSRAMAKCALITALLTRFACNGWMRDMYDCSIHFSGGNNQEMEYMFLHWVGERSFNKPASVQSAVKLVERFRASFNAGDISEATELSRLENDIQDERALSRFLIALANTF